MLNLKCLTSRRKGKPAEVAIMGRKGGVEEESPHVPLHLPVDGTCIGNATTGATPM